MQKTAPPATYRVKSFGCQMNVYDGERMAELLAEQGITPAPEGEAADLVVLGALGLVAEHVVGGGHLLELLLRLLVALIAVRVVLHGQLLEGLLDFILGGGL